jgi:uncharacterized protein (DUF2236 family)
MAATASRPAGVSPAEFDGYFPRSSMLHQVQRHRAVGLFFGQRALMIGAAKPLNFVGTAEHSNGNERPFRRLAHTGVWFETIFFGTRAEADKVLAAVHKMHERVHGELAEDAGPWPAGSPYSALSTEEMLWTIAVMMDSAEVFHDLLVRRLEEDERERLWQDYARFGELFGMPRDEAPATYREFRAYWDAQLEPGVLFLTEEARYVGRAVAFEIPMRAPMQPFKRVHDAIMLGALPPVIRELYGMSYSSRDALAFRAATAALRTSRPLLPGRATRGRNTMFFEGVAETERYRIEHGIPTPQVLKD